MIYTLEQIRHDVMSRMGETPEVSPSSSLGSIPHISQILDRKIRSLVPEFGSKLILDAPLEKLTGAEEYTADITPRKSKCGLYAFDIPLPDDFLRLVSVRMKSWERAVLSVITPDSDKYLCQYSPEPGIAGCPSRPMAYLSPGILTAIGSASPSDSLDHLLLWRIPSLSPSLSDSSSLSDSLSFPASLYPLLLSQF